VVTVGRNPQLWGWSLQRTLSACVSAQSQTSWYAAAVGKISQLLGIPAAITGRYDSLTITMDELAAARAELNQLEKQEQELLKQLFAVRFAAQAQRTKVEGLIKQVPPPVDRLPSELLFQIIELSIQTALVPCKSCDVHLEWKRELMKVSRRWRNLILHSPSLWSTIKVTPTWREQLVRDHVASSRQYPLDIEICSWSEMESRDRLVALLDIVTPCAHRWRSLAIRDDSTELHRSLVLELLDRMTFPTLTSVSMLNAPPFLDNLDGSSTQYTADFLAPERSPRLKFLELGVLFISIIPFRVPSGLVNLRLVLDDPFRLREVPPFFLELLSCNLTSLSLSGACWTFDQLPPNSVQFPLLETLVCSIRSGGGLMQALVAPMLSHFEYCPPVWDASPDAMFAGLGDKFSSVIRLVLSGTDSLLEVKAIHSTFPNVRHMVLRPHDSIPIFRPGDDSPSEPTWRHLESLTVDGPKPFSRDWSTFPYHLVRWLKHRQHTRQPKLRVRLSTVYATVDWSTIWDLHEMLHELCILEWAGVRFKMKMKIFGNSDSLQLVCMPTFYTTLAHLLSCLFRMFLGCPLTS